MADYKIKIIVEGEDRASGALGGIAGSLTRMGEIAGGIGITRVFDAVTDGAVKFGSALVGMVADAGGLEAQIDGIGAVAGASQGELAELSTLINDLGINPNLKVSTQEAADAIEMLVRNGLALEDVFGGAAEQTVLLANSTGADFSAAADIATDAMAIFGIGADDMATAVNGITGVVASSKFDIYDYQLALSQGGAAAAVAGVSFEDFNTSVAAVASNFASGSDAGTSLKTMIQRLVPQSKEAAAAMADLGLEFSNADGSMKDMSEIAGELNRAFSGLSEEQRISYLTTIFGTDAMRAAAGMAQYTAEEYQALQERIGNTDALVAARQRMDNLSGDVEIFGGVLEAVKLQVGASFMEPARVAVQGLTSVLSQATPVLLSWAEQAAAWATPYVEGVVSTLTDPQWQADVAGQVQAFWDNYTTNNRIAFNLGDVLEVDFSLDGADKGVTKFKLGDFFEFVSEDGQIETIHLDQVIDFSNKDGITKLKLLDIFDFEGGPGGTKWAVKDLISFEGLGDEEFTLTIGGFKYTSQPQGEYVVTKWTYQDKPLGEVISAETTASLVLLGGYFDGFAVAVEKLTSWEMPKPSEFADEMIKAFGVFGGYLSGFGVAADALKGFQWPTLPAWKWPDLPAFKWPDMPKFSWPSLPTWSWPELPAFSWPTLPAWKWPDLPAFKWPDMPKFSWPSLPTWSWPSLPSWHWPAIPVPSWLSWLMGGGGDGGTPPGGQATGGRASGLTWVGEFGPELVNLPGGSYVYTAGQSRRMATAGGVQQVFHFAPVINTPLDMEEALRRLADMARRRSAR